MGLLGGFGQTNDETGGREVGVRGEARERGREGSESDEREGVRFTLVHLTPSGEHTVPKMLAQGRHVQYL